MCCYITNIHTRNLIDCGTQSQGPAMVRCQHTPFKVVESLQTCSSQHTHLYINHRRINTYIILVTSVYNHGSFLTCLMPPPRAFRTRLALAIKPTLPTSRDPTGAPNPLDRHTETELACRLRSAILVLVAVAVFL